MRVRELIDRWRTLGRRYRVGFYAVVVLNVIVIAAYAWSQTPQTVVVEVTNQGRFYEAFVDGRRLPTRFELEVPEQGTVWLEVAPGLPSVQSPSGVDSIEVRERTTGRLLFRDDFDVLRLNVWEVKDGSFAIEDGVLTARSLTTPNNLVLDNRTWPDATVRDYTVRVTYRNGVGGSIGSHVAPDGGAFYSFELMRDFPTFFDARKDGKQTAYVPDDSVYIKPDGDGTLRSIVFMLTRSYPYVAGGLFAGMWVVFALAFVGHASSHLLHLRRRRSSAVGGLSAGWLVGPLPRGEGTRWEKLDLAVVAIAGLVLAAFVVTLRLNLHYYAALPHVPDEVAYMFQAKLIAAGHVMVPKPPVTYAFDFYELPFMYERGELWASFYPFGHPAVLAVGARFGLMWLVPSLVGAACVGLTYAIGRRFYGTAAGLLAAGLMLASPFFLMQSSNFMSHNTAAMFTLLCLLFVLKRERPLVYGLIAGLAFGMAVNTRPVTAVAMVPAFGLVMLGYLWAMDTRRDAIRHTAGFIAGALVMVALMLGYNYGLTGNFLQSAYSDNPAATIGFNHGHTIETGLRNQQAQVASLLLVFTGWPMWAGLALVGLPFLLGTRDKWDYFCLLAALSLMGIYLLYRYSGIFEGPRYWYEAMPFMFLLSARGAQKAIEVIALAVGLVRSRLFGPQAPPRLAAGVVVYGALAVLVVYGTGGWLTGADRGWDVWNAHLIPNSPQQMKQLFGVDDRVVKVADETPLHRALVLVEPCGFFRSANCFGSVFLRNDIHFDGDVVWARYVEGRVAEVIAAFPGRAVYVATWDDGASIVPFERYRPGGMGGER